MITQEITEAQIIRDFENKIKENSKTKQENILSNIVFFEPEQINNKRGLKGLNPYPLL